MFDNEGDMNSMVKNLISLWTALLKNSNDVLKIDSEYTRPGIIAFLEDFKKKIKNV